MSHDVINVQNWKMSIRDTLRRKQDKEVLNCKMIHEYLGGEEGFPKYSSLPNHVSLRASLKIPPMMLMLRSKTWNSPHYSVCFSPDILKKKVSFQVFTQSWASEKVCESKNGTLTEYPLWRGWSTLPLRGRPSPFSVVFPFVKKRTLAFEDSLLSDSEDVALIR